MSAGPIRFRPVARTKVWGGRRLAERLGRDLPEGPIGESWDVSARPEAPSIALNGPRPGTRPDELLGAPFPLLVKVLDATQVLSVQVHPGPEVAARLPGSEPKHEAWVVLDVEPGARLYRGFVDGVDRAAVEDALAEGHIEDLLRSFEPRVGDVVEVPPGTVHAIGAGCLLLEVQQPSDTTFRVWDWGRLGLDGKPRTLHLEEALASFRYDVPGGETVDARTGKDGREILVDAPALRLERVRASAGRAAPLAADRVHVVSHVGGEPARLRGDDRALRYGDSALLLPGESEVALAEGEATLLLGSAEVSR